MSGKTLSPAFVARMKSFDALRKRGYTPVESVEKWLSMRGYHMTLVENVACYESSDVDQALRKFRDNGVNPSKVIIG